MFKKVTQSNARFDALDTLTIVVHSVRMPMGFDGTKNIDKPLSVMAHPKKSIIEIKVETNSLAQALIIAIAKVTRDSNYKSYLDGRKYDL